MEELLKWSIENTDKDTLRKNAESIAQGETSPRKLDPAIIDMILGKDDATRMRELMETIQRGDEVSLEEREQAFDELEMLVESIDNANNITSLSLWQPLVLQLYNPHPSLRLAACWVCGTAVQNNPAAQSAFLSHKGLDAILQLILADPDQGVRSKALYCLSGTLKHYQTGIEEFGKLRGWEIVSSILSESPTDPVTNKPAPSQDLPFLRKTVFLCTTLLLTSQTILPAMKATNFVSVLIELLRRHIDDEDIAEKGVKAFKAYITAGGDKEEISQAIDIIRRIRMEYPGISMEEEDWKIIGL